MIYISKNNDGIFHKCPKLKFIYNNWGKENDYFICNLCQIKFPTFLALPFPILKGLGGCNDYRIGIRTTFFPAMPHDDWDIYIL